MSSVPGKTDKTKEQILAERQAKKNAKKQGNKKEQQVTGQQQQQPKPSDKPADPKPPQELKTPTETDNKAAPGKEPSKKAQKNVKKSDAPAKPATAVVKEVSVQPDNKAKCEVSILTEATEKLSITSPSEAKPTLTKAERRAKQEAQRAAKAKELEKKLPAAPAVVKEKVSPKKVSEPIIKKSPVIAVTQSAAAIHKVKLFKHLYTDKCNLNINVNQDLHPAILKLGMQFANDTIVGSNARCYAFLNAMKIVRIRP